MDRIFIQSSTKSLTVVMWFTIYVHGDMLNEGRRNALCVKADGFPNQRPGESATKRCSPHEPKSETRLRLFLYRLLYRSLPCRLCCC